MSSSFEQLLNNFSGISVSEDGILMVVNAEQELKADSPIALTVLGSATCCIL